MTYQVMEIFNSYQGEGSMMGRACTFVRLAGCNLTCSFCDTKESWKKDQQVLTIEEILQACKEKYVIITGGEPLLQDLRHLVEALHLKGHQVGIETNGTLALYNRCTKATQEFDWVSCSPKYDSQYCCVSMESVDEFKFVVDEKFDINHPNIRRVAEDAKGCKIWLQPEGYNVEKSLKKIYTILDSMTPQERGRYRVGVQLHKILNIK